MNKIADIQLGPPGGFRGIGPLGLQGETSDIGIVRFTKVISSTIGVLTVIAAIWFIFQLFTGAISIISAGGDKAKMEEARKKITNSLTGLVVVVVGVFLIDLVGSLIGLDILKLTEIITGLAP